MKLHYTMSTNTEYKEKLDVDKSEVSHERITYLYGDLPKYDIETILNELARDPYKTKTIKYLNNDEYINNELNIQLSYKNKTLDLIGLLHDYSVSMREDGTMYDIITWCSLHSGYTLDQLDSLRGRKYNDAVNLVLSRIGQ